MVKPSSTSDLSVFYNKPLLFSESMLSARRGAMFPIEILTIIFYMAIESYNQPYTPDMEGILLEEARTIRAASQVCQFWRDVSFSCHRIWGTILNVDSSSTFWIIELLRRSGSAPLTILSTASNHRSFESKKWELIFAQTHRFRTLYITLGNRDIHALVSIFRQPAPLLESLTLKYDQDNGFYRSVDVTISLPKSLFAGVTPKLRAFTLEKVLFRWSPSDQVAQNIVRLDLSLSQKNVASFSFDYRSTAKMVLPNLQEFVVTGTGRCARFLSFLAIPSSCMTTLSFTQRDPDPSLIDDPLLWVEEYLRGWQARHSPIHSWYLSTTQDNAFSFHAGTKDDPLDRPQFVLEYNAGFYNAGIRLRYLVDFLRRESVLHESAALRLDLQASLYFSGELAERLAGLLSQCVRLETLTLLGRSIENIMVPFLTKYPEATAHLRHLIVDGPYPASFASMLSLMTMLRQYALQPLKNGGDKLQKITLCVDDSLKYVCLKKGLSDMARVVSHTPLRPRVVRRGELTPRDGWSLGP